jgi:hypothetical protein
MSSMAAVFNSPNVNTAPSGKYELRQGSIWHSLCESQVGGDPTTYLTLSIFRHPPGSFLREVARRFL